ncbi:MAG: DNA (cytosine-5-)-methyltransferase [Muribaculaceae bacterium]|nr:DNA (cytosine-5-)-methyltransferase [Muribaculaceae bacterium]
MPIKYETPINQTHTVCAPIEAYSRINARRQLSLDLFAPANDEVNGNEIRVIELFAGVGGFRIGLERASHRFRTIWSNQWEPSTKRQDASSIYCKRFGCTGHVNEDIATVTADRIPQADLLCGGFPCQDYSVATTLKNSGGIQGKKGVLWWEIHRILSNAPHKPAYLLLENVDRLLKSPATQRGRDFAIILTSLSDIGYDVEWRVINAADYGMPQRRCRTYITAYLRNGAVANNQLRTQHTPWEWILKQGIMASAFECQPKKDKKYRISEFDLNGSLADISNNFNAIPAKKASPFFNAGFMSDRHVWTTDVDAVYNGPRLTLGDILIDEADIPEEFYIPEADLPKWEYLKGSKSETRKTTEGYEYLYTEGSMTFPDVYDRPSRTIITGEGGASPSRFKHVIITSDGRYRRLTPIELERLNMFPDNHTQGATDSRRAFLMGNALVTGIVETLGREIIKRHDNDII